MSSPPIRIAVIGVGLIGPRHARAVLANPDTELAAIVDPATSTSEPLAAELGAAYFPSIPSLLAAGRQTGSPVVDAAIICTPNHTHVGVAADLAAAGIHVLIEKPLSGDVASGRDLVRRLKEQNRNRTSSASDPASSSSSSTTPPPPVVRALVGHHRRFNPYVVATKRILASGRLGRVLALSGLWATYKPDAYFQGGGAWRSDPARGGGVVLINLVHEIDVLHHLFGPIARVHAERVASVRGGPGGERGNGSEESSRGVVEEGAALALRFRGGLVATFVLADHAPSPHNFEAGTGENPLIPRVPGADCYRVLGTEASLSVPDMTLWSYGGARGGNSQGEEVLGVEKSWSSPLTRETVGVDRGVSGGGGGGAGDDGDAGDEGDDGSAVPFARQLAHFVRVVRGEEEPSCSVEAGLAALIVCEAVREALRGNTTVDIEEYEL